MGVGAWCGTDVPRTYADNIQTAEDSLQLHHFGPRDFDRAFFHFLLPGRGSLTRTQIDYALFTILGIKLDDIGQRNFEEYLKIFEETNEPGKYNFTKMVKSMYLLSGKRTIDKAANFFRLYDTEGSGGKYYLTPERFEKLVEDLCEIIYVTTRHFCDISPSTFDFHRKEFEDDRRKLYEKAVEIIYQKGLYDKVNEEQFLTNLMNYETQVGYPILSAAGIRKRTLKFLYTEVKRVAALENQTAETRLPMYPTGPRKDPNRDSTNNSMLRMLPADLRMPSSPSGELRVFGSPLRKPAA